MALTNAERQARYRERLKRTGYVRQTFSLPPETYERLKGIAVMRGLTQDQLMTALIDEAWKAEKNRG